MEFNQAFNDRLLVFVIPLVSVSGLSLGSLETMTPQIDQECEVTKSRIPEFQQQPCEKGNACLYEIRNIDLAYSSSAKYAQPTPFRFVTDTNATDIDVNCSCLLYGIAYSLYTAQRSVELVAGRDTEGDWKAR